MAYEALYGGLGGAVVGGVASGIQAYQARKDASRMRRRTRAGIRAGVQAGQRSVGGILSSPEYQAASNFIRQFFGLGNAAADTSESFSTEYGGGTPDDIAQRFRRGKFAEGGRGFGMAGTSANVPDTLTADFAKGLRAAQAARGIFESPVAAGGEAAGLASFRANLQAQLLPQLFGLAEGPARLRSQYEGFHTQREVLGRTGGQSSFGPGVLSGALSGGLSGLFSGAALGTEYATAFQEPEPEMTYAQAPVRGAQASGSVYGRIPLPYNVRRI